jgi:hypothetical protein
MTKTDPNFTVEKSKKVYPTIAGYMLIKPFIDQYLEKNPGAKTREINKWGKSNEKYIAEIRSQDLTNENTPLTLSI